MREIVTLTGTENDAATAMLSVPETLLDASPAMSVSLDPFGHDGCLVSIVIPTYNSGAVLPGCVESILSQTFSDFEIMLIDGGSTDNTVALIREQAGAHKNIRWISEKDAGIYDAMNKGIRLAKGRWLLFFGADDRLHDPSVLACVAPHLNDDADFVYGNVVLTNDPFGREGMIYKGEFSVADIVAQNICHQAIFYSRDLFALYGGYNVKYRAFADWDLNLRVFNRVRKKFLEITVANFNGGGMSADDDDPEFHARFVEIITTELALEPGSEIYRSQTRGLRRLLKYYVARGQLGAAFKYFGIWLRHEQFWPKLKNAVSRKAN